MTTDEIRQRIEAILDKPDDRLAAELPELLSDIDGQIEKLLLEHPALFARITQRMDAVDMGVFASEHPATVERFQSMLWTGMGLLVQASPDVRASITEDITVNFEANDAPMTGHLEVREEEQEIVGGTELIENPDLTITGPADELVGLITGTVDPIQGFMQQKFEMDGPIQKGTQLAATMGQLTKLLPS